MSTASLSRQSSFVSSHHSRTVDDIVIQNQEYVYPGDARVIIPRRGSSLRRTGSMADLDEECKSAVNRARGGPGASALFGASPVTISSGSSLGKDIFMTPPPSTRRGSESDRARSDVSHEHFFSGSSDGARSTYFSHTSLTSTGGPRTMTVTGATSLTGATSVTGATSFTGGPTASASQTHTPSSATLTASYRLSRGVVPQRQREWCVGRVVRGLSIDALARAGDPPARRREHALVYFRLPDGRVGVAVGPG